MEKMIVRELGDFKEISVHPLADLCVDSYNATIKQKNCYILVTGSFLNWIGSYGQAKNMQPQANVMGYFKLSGKERKIEVVL